MSYIRFTANSLTEDQQDAIATVVDLFCETVVFEDDDSDCTYYETELGQSLEFALEDFTVEATGQ